MNIKSNNEQNNTHLQEDKLYAKRAHRLKNNKLEIYPWRKCHTPDERSNNLTRDLWRLKVDSKQFLSSAFASLSLCIYEQNVFSKKVRGIKVFPASMRRAMNWTKYNFAPRVGILHCCETSRSFSVTF